MLGVVVVAADDVYGGKMHVLHELQQNCAAVTDHGELFRRLRHV